MTYVDILFQHKLQNNVQKFKLFEGLVFVFFCETICLLASDIIENEMKSLWLVRKNEKIV